MSDSDLPKIGAPAARSTHHDRHHPGSSRSPIVASPNYSPSTDSAHEHSAF